MGDPNSVVRSRNSNCPNALATLQVWRFHKLTMGRENQSVLTAGAAVAVLLVLLTLQSLLFLLQLLSVGRAAVAATTNTATSAAVSPGSIILFII